MVGIKWEKQRCNPLDKTKKVKGSREWAWKWGRRNLRQNTVDPRGGTLGK